MGMNKSIAVALLSLALGAVPGGAVVYTLRPGTPSGSVLETLQAREALQEPLSVNGHDGILRVATTALSLSDAVANLKPLLGNYQAFRGGSAVLLEATEANGDLVRHYILSLGSQRRTLVFTMQVPGAALKPAKASTWPAMLPKPDVERLELVVELTKRDAFYASFVCAGNAGTAFRRYDARLRDAGWRAVGEGDGTCTVYMNDKSRRLLAFSVMDGADGAHGALFMAHSDSAAP